MKISKRKVQANIVYIIFALIFISIPWESIRDYPFNDLYINILKYENINQYFNTDVDFFSIKSFISDEPLWYLINLLFFKFGFTGEFVFSALAFFSIVVVSNYIYNNDGKNWYILLLIHPVFLDFTLSQQRNALVFSLFLFLLDKGKVKYIFYSFFSLIHSFSPFLIIMACFSDFFRKKSDFIIKISILLLSLSLAIFLVYGRIFLSSYTDDTRFQDYEVPVNSLLYIIPWLIYFIWIFFGSKKITVNYIILSIMLSMYIFLTVMDFYAIRFLAMSIPLIIANLGNLKFKKYFYIIFIIHQCMLLYLWINVGVRI